MTNTEALSVEEVIVKFRNGDYEMKTPMPTKPKFVQDEEKSIKWNKMQEASHDQRYEEEKKSWYNAKYALNKTLHKDAQKALAETYKITDKQSEQIYDFALSQKDSGFVSNFQFAMEIAELFDEIKET